MKTGTIKTICYSLLIGLVALGMTMCSQPSQPADYVFTNGKVYTVNPDQPWAEAVAIKGNEIVFVGSNEESKKLAGENTKVADLEGRLVLPGLIDAHYHALTSAVVTSGVVLAAIPTVEEVLTAIRSYAEAHPEKEVIFGWGYMDHLFGSEGPMRELLDQVVPDRPAYILCSDGHSGWANTKALQAAGIDKNTPDPAPPVGVFGRDAQGNPTGPVNGSPATMWMVNNLPGALSAESISEAANTLFNATTEEGITAIFDAGNSFATDDGFQSVVEMDRNGKLPFRYYASHYINADYMADDAIERLKELDSKYHSEKFKILALKITLDGIVENRLAAYWEPYNDGTGSGALNFSPETVTHLSVEAAREGYDVYMHTMGDRAVSIGLDAAEAVRSAGYNESNITLSHVQSVVKRDYARFKTEDVMINSTGGWWTFGGGVELKEAALGQRAHEEFPYRHMIDEGVVFAQGSDFPADPRISPFIHMEGSVTRLFYGIPGLPASTVVSNPTNRLSVEEAIESYTLNGAKLVHMEDKVGSLEVGKLADLIVVDQNILEIDPGQIHKTKVLFTMMDGKIWHDIILGWGDAVDDPLPDIQVDGICAEHDIPH